MQNTSKNEYHLSLFGDNSFQYALVTDNFWDIKKYWYLELYLISLIEQIQDDSLINKSLASDIFYLYLSIEDSISSTMNPNDVWKITNLEINEILEYKSRLDIIVKLFWGKLKLVDYEKLIYENPFYSKHNPHTGL